MLYELFYFTLGIVLLVSGAWSLVTGGSRIAAQLGVAPVVIGLTVVAFGTSAPELFVCLVAAWRDNNDLMIGNVIGSNLANIGLILGSAALLMPVRVEKRLFRRQVPFLIFSTIVFAFLSWDRVLSHIDGGVLTLLFIVFMVYTVRFALKQKSENGRRSASLPGDSRPTGMVMSVAMVVGGIGFLSYGGHLIVESAVVIATELGASEAFIGLTLVAVGTSLPELATTVMASFRKESDIALGNVIGSNLFNLLGVAGPVALIQPVVTHANVRTHQLPVLVVVTILLWFMGRQTHVSRTWGGALLLIYLGIMVGWCLSGV
ncbi:MAG: calcium/sodium antiporter [bacterium]